MRVYLRTRRHERRQDDVHDVEGVAPAQVYVEDDVGEALVETALEEELVTWRWRPLDLPLAVRLVRVHVDLQWRQRLYYY